MKKTYNFPQCKMITLMLNDIITASQNVDYDITVSVTDVEDFWGEQN